MPDGCIILLGSVSNPAQVVAFESVNKRIGRWAENLANFFFSPSDHFSYKFLELFDKIV